MAGKDNLVSISSRSTEVQREIRSKGGKARAKKARERKTIAEALRFVLDEKIEKGSKETRLDAISRKAIYALFQAPSIKGMKILAEILGELKDNESTAGVTININASEDGKANIEKILNGE